MNFSVNARPGSRGGKGGPYPHAPKTRGTPLSRMLISLAVTLVAGAIYFYVELPALNLQDYAFYFFLLFLCVVYAVCNFLLGGVDVVRDSVHAGQVIRQFAKQLPVLVGIVLLILAVMAVGALVGAPVFRADAYSQLLEVEDSDFTADVAEIDWDQIPLLDGASANNLANRKLGELSDLVSQFEVSTSSTQINYRNTPVRVTYLDYSNFFKWISNQSTGIPAYMAIDMRTQEVNVVRLEEGIHYSPSEYFGRDLYRHLRFQYPTLLFDNINFEIDDDGTPYWIASVVKRTIGLFGGTDVAGAVMVNAVTGESVYCPVAEIPSWVDRVYSSDLLIRQYDYRGLYVNGFFNALFSQSGCTQTTDGYNYVVLNDDVWMYTGITSITSDEGNIGFILVNQRTKDARYYSCAGAEEYSAMYSAEGAVQQYSYESTFPLLLNVSNQPTYFMALKDSAGLVKMYAMVNVRQYQIVATGYTLEACQNSYHDLLVSNALIEAGDQPGADADAETVSGALAEIRSAAIDGNTVYYLRLEAGDIYYTVSAKDYPLAVILNVGDTVTLEYIPTEGALQPIKTLTLQ